jgi:hypothetical protein
LTFHPNGTLTEPGGKPILLRGFTFDYKRGPHGGHSQKNVTDEDRQVSTLLPNTNFARLVMVHWHDEPTRHHMITSITVYLHSISLGLKLCYSVYLVYLLLFKVYCLSFSALTGLSAVSRVTVSGHRTPDTHSHTGRSIAQSHAVTAHGSRLARRLSPLPHTLGAEKGGTKFKKVV